MPGAVNWLFGRGLSLACNLTWTVPAAWASIEREEKILLIKGALRTEMERPEIDCTIIHEFLAVLAGHTATGWRHRLMTTNWDFLLQREVLAQNFTVQPPYLTNTLVYHLNGTVEELEDNRHRSPFLLEEDSVAQRGFTPEANMAYNAMILDFNLVVVGMSFECETDRFLLTALNRVEDDLPIGESECIVVNPDRLALDAACARLRAALPRANVIAKNVTFNEWLRGQVPELRKSGAMVF